MVKAEHRKGKVHRMVRAVLSSMQCSVGAHGTSVTVKVADVQSAMVALNTENNGIISVSQVISLSTIRSGVEVASSTELHQYLKSISKRYDSITEQQQALMRSRVEWAMAKNVLDWRMNLVGKFNCWNKLLTSSSAGEAAVVTYECDLPMVANEDMVRVSKDRVLGNDILTISALGSKSNNQKHHLALAPRDDWNKNPYAHVCTRDLTALSEEMEICRIFKNVILGANVENQCSFMKKIKA